MGIKYFHKLNHNLVQSVYLRQVLSACSVLQGSKATQHILLNWNSQQKLHIYRLPAILFILVSHLKKMWEIKDQVNSFTITKNFSYIWFTWIHFDSCEFSEVEAIWKKKINIPFKKKINMKSSLDLSKLWCISLVGYSHNYRYFH